MTGINNLQTLFGTVGGTQENGGPTYVKMNPAATSGTTTTLKAGDGQRVSVSSAAGALSQVSDTSDVRQDKVAQLQAAIASGSYSVSSSDVAGKLIDSMLNGN